MLRFVSAAISAIAFVLIAPPSHAEENTGTTIESRLILAFKAPDAAVQNMLPEGWTSLTLPQGPLAGSNMLITLMDRHLILDADGMPKVPAFGPTAALFTYAVKEGEKGARGFVVRTYEEPPLTDPYSTSVQADIERVYSLKDAGDAGRSISESWTILPTTGGEITIELSSALGGYLWSTDQTAQPYSATVPEFSRIYHYNQLVSPLMSKAAGRELNGKISVTLNDPEIANLFDGTEALVGILSIPQYQRKITKP